ncbi:hypothetical protein ACEN2P_00765 [Pedobacter psychrotolerans]|uniref:hypothetical protein n=1 Tax=Pedobacter psychrotolerans TaxID=1843235 RepID=UPI003F9D0403
MLQITFTIATLLCVILFYYGTKKNKIVSLIYFTWLVIIGSITLSGFFVSNPKSFIVAIVSTIALSVFVFQKVDVGNINQKILLAIHLLRIPVEVILFGLFIQKKIPVLMTFQGWNFDIVIGITAIFFLLTAFRRESKIKDKVFLVWNVFGLIFLTIIVVIAILSSPLPIQQFGFEQPNIAILEFPFCFLPTIIVPIVALSHLLLIKCIINNGRPSMQKQKFQDKPE